MVVVRAVGKILFTSLSLLTLLLARCTFLSKTWDVAKDSAANYFLTVGGWGSDVWRARACGAAARHALGRTVCPCVI